MDRPVSIINFERLYLGSLAIGVVSTAINWSTMQAQVAATPNSGMLPGWFLPVTIIAGFLIPILLWYFAARRAAVVAKWIIVVLFAIGLLSIPALFTVPNPILVKLFAGVNFVLQAVAVWMLFKPDAKQWFAGDWSDGKDIFS